jgi:hypothetical protein
MVSLNEKNTRRDIAEATENSRELNKRLDRTNIELRDAQIELGDKVTSKEG